jgi:hypothetical protein
VQGSQRSIEPVGFLADDADADDAYDADGL